MAILMFAASWGEAQELSHSEFFGHSPELARRLEIPVTLAWKDVPLRTAAERLATTQKVSLWIDRRVDPGQLVGLDVSQVPLREVCDRLASQIDLAWVAYGNVVYIGPTQQTAELRTLRALARRGLAELPAEKRQAWLRPQPLSIARLSEPKDVVSRLLEVQRVRPKNLDAIPHDVWPARELPAMAPADQLTLLLAGFDLTWKLDSAGTSLEIKPVERPVVIERRVPREADARRVNGIVAGDKEAKLENKQGTSFLVGRVEQHEELIDRPRPRDVAPPRPKGTQVYSLTIREQPLEGLLRQLTSKLGLTLELSPKLDSQTLGARVSFSVSEAPAEELFAEIGKAASVEIALEGDVVRVAPSE